VSAAVSVYGRDKNLYSLHALSQNYSFYTFHDNSVHTDGQTDEYIYFMGEYIYFMESETLPSTCYMLSVEASIPFYSRVTGIMIKTPCIVQELLIYAKKHVRVPIVVSILLCWR